MAMKGVRLEGKQLEEFYQACTIFNTDGNNKVSRDQAQSIIRAIGLSPTNDQMNEMLGDRDRSFDQKELHAIISSKAPQPETEESLREAFRIFDKEGNGFAEAKELRHALTNLGERLSDDQVDEMIREVEVNGANLISCDENIISFGVKQFGSRLDAALRGVSSGSSLFAT